MSEPLLEFNERIDFDNSVKSQSREAQIKYIARQAETLLIRAFNFVSYHGKGKGIKVIDWGRDEEGCFMHLQITDNPLYAPSDNPTETT